MRHFAALLDTLEAAVSDEERIDALAQHFGEVPAADAAWALALLGGHRPRRVLSADLTREMATRASGLPPWLFAECERAAGDLAETVAHVLPAPPAPVPRGLAEWFTEHLLPARALPAPEQAARFALWLGELDAPGRDLLVKLLVTGWRTPVDVSLVQRALARHARLSAALIALRMDAPAGAHQPPGAEAFQHLLAPAGAWSQDDGLPHDLAHAHALTIPREAVAQGLAHLLGPRAHWQVEWRYDGCRAQVVRRAGRCWIWTRDAALITRRVPEVAAQAAELPDGCVLDGVLLAWGQDGPLPGSAQQLQARLGLRAPSRQRRAQTPVRFIAFDLLESDGLDRRRDPWHRRHARLQALLARGPFAWAPPVQGDDWPALAAAHARCRSVGMQGLVLKHREATYGDGPGAGGVAWWAWKAEPLRVDAVLIYAQDSRDARAGERTDYTFAVWNRMPRDADEVQAVLQAIERREPARPGALQLMPVAKTSAGLTAVERRRLDQVVREHTVEKFGPVRSLRPLQVVEIGFEAVDASARHKSGLTLRSPRMLRLRDDRPLGAAGTLDAIRGQA